MADYIERLNDENPNNDTGNFWVYDTDGWAYWAAPIDPDSATGLLLDGIARTETIINEDWYYGINVVAQFITGDDLGQFEGTGFYDMTDTDSEPTDEALLLLNAIGVDVVFEVKAEEGETMEQALQEALNHGGTIRLTENVTIREPLTVSADTVLDLGAYTITPDAGATIFEGDDWSLLSVRGADTTLTINSGSFIASPGDSYCVDVRDGARVVINGGSFNGNISAVYVLEGELVVNGGEFQIQQTGGAGTEYNYVLNCYDDNYANGTASIVVCGGTFYGFDPSALVEIGGKNYLADGYKVEPGEGENIYTVKKS